MLQITICEAPMSVMAVMPSPRLVLNIKILYDNICSQTLPVLPKDLLD